MIDKGYIHIYTGNGKGKTTAALGLALRAAGAGLKTIIIQFMKGQSYSEHESLKLLSEYITVEQYGSKDFYYKGKSSVDEHKQYANNGYSRAMEVLRGEKFSVVILDEIITTRLFDLLQDSEIIELIENKSDGKELILTGRGASEDLIEKANLVTEMKEVKHYYTEGVLARKGIED